MKIKERIPRRHPHHDLLRGFAQGSRHIGRSLVSHRVKLGIYFLIVLGTLIVGIFGGMGIAGVFGTFDAPSPRALAVIHAFGIGGLRDLQATINNYKAENIKIPFNWIAARFAQPERLTIDINFENYQRLAYNRERALALGVLVATDEDYVPATLTYQGKHVKANVRLKGDNTDHIAGDKWSLRLKIKGDETLMGMKTFSIQAPERRRDLLEWIYLQALRDERVLALRYDFVEVVINGEKMGVYAVEEHFDKYLVESQGRLDGPLLKFDAEEKRDQTFIREQTNYSRIFSDAVDFYPASVISVYKPSTLADPLREQQFNEAKNLLESWRSGRMKTSNVFDQEKLATYFAVTTLLGGHHASLWSNIVFYYNPVTSRLEPIGSDAEIGNLIYQGVSLYAPPCFEDELNCTIPEGDYFGRVFSDRAFYKSYIQELERISTQEYLDEYFLRHEGELKTYTQFIHRERPSYHLFREQFYDNQAYLQSTLNPVKPVNAYFQEATPSIGTVQLYVGNAHELPIDITGLWYNTTELQIEYPVILHRLTPGGITEYVPITFFIPYGFSWQEGMQSSLQVEYRVVGTARTHREPVIPWSYIQEDFPQESFLARQSNAEEFSFLNVDKALKTVTVAQGNWNVDQSIIFPHGYTTVMNAGTVIDLTANSTLLFYGPVQFKGMEGSPIVLTSSDKSARGVVVLQAQKPSSVSYTRFENFQEPLQGNWHLTGAVTTYESPIVFDHAYFGNMDAEDALNVKRSSVVLKNSVFNQTKSDCFDLDFGTGDVLSSSFYACGNDGVDLSGSTVKVKDIYVYGQGDKGISSGENSTIVVYNAHIENGYIGMASKDLSFFTVQNATLVGNEYGLALYQKKSEFGAGTMNAYDITFQSNTHDYIKDKFSILSIDNKQYITSEKGDVYAKLYPN